MTLPIAQRIAARTFPPFSLERLLRTTFAPQPGQRLCLLIDLEDPARVKDFTFLQDPSLSIQRHAVESFLRPLQDGVLASLGLAGGELFAYRTTGGSNLDLPDEAFTPEGRQVSLSQEVYPRYDIILCISTFSATAPLTASAKQHGFRGATLHGVNDIILSTGLAVDYREVSAEAEKLRLGVTRADWIEIEFGCEGRILTLRLLLGGQEAQKSHGLCLGEEPDVANLPAGEVYFVPEGAEGQFPHRYEDGTLGIMEVSGGRIVRASLLRGNAATVEAHNAKLAADPVTGELGELGLGTQLLPASGRDIQDEKVRGTVHVATGRSDHLGGHLVPSMFAQKSHATHDDILFAPHKTPEILVREVRMQRGPERQVLIQNYEPSAYLDSLVA
jgi:aminopeptidase